MFVTGIRLGKMFVKIGLIKMMQKFDFETVDNEPIKLSNYSILMNPKHSITLSVSHRKQQ